MGSKIKAAVMIKPGEIQLREFPWPKLEEGSMLIKIEISGICGTDKHAYRGRKDYTFPLIPGHENVGVIVEITKKASKEIEFSGEILKEGDRVVVCPDILCGKCFFCKHSNGFTWCENIRSYGANLSIKDPPYITGGWSEYMYIFPGSFVYKVPKKIPLEIVVLMEPMAGTYSIDKLRDFTSFSSEGLIPGFSVVIQGLGPIGLMYITKAKLLGASKVIAIGKYQNQLEMAKKFKADYLINVSKISMKNIINFVKGITKGRGVDLVINCTGIQSVISDGLEMLRKGGIFLEISAIANSGMIPFSTYKVCTESLRIIGMSNCAYIGFIPALELMKQYSTFFPFEKIVTHKYPLEKIEEAINKSLESESLKVVVVP